MTHWRVPFDINTIKIPHGNVHILVERCKGCAFCEEYCPKDHPEADEVLQKGEKS